MSLVDIAILSFVCSAITLFIIRILLMLALRILRDYNIIPEKAQHNDESDETVSTEFEILFQKLMISELAREENEDFILFKSSLGVTFVVYTERRPNRRVEMNPPMMNFSSQEESLLIELFDGININLISDSINVFEVKS